MNDYLLQHARGIVAKLQIKNALVREYAVRILAYLLSKPKCDVPNIDKIPALLTLRPQQFELALVALVAGNIVTVYEWEEEINDITGGDSQSN